MNLFMAIVSIVVPFIYIFGGILFTFNPPQYGSRGISYRTRRSQLSQKTWDYSNHSFGVVSIFLGIYLAAFTGLIDAFLKYVVSVYAWVITAAVIAVQIIFVLIPINYIEKHLKVYFDENGDDMYPDTLEIKDKKSDDDWDDWSTWPGDEEQDKRDGWVDWDTWLKNKDEELDKQKKASAKNVEDDSEHSTDE
ncbi:MAG: SdpI family protein [Eubacteriales bacterium]|jgi:hypothetical protein|nr:SdpI family protein [Eubacteriales bacterium]